MKAREIVLLILIIAVGVFFYHAHTGKIDWGFDWDEGFFFATEEFSYEESQRLDPPYPLSLQVINAHGDITIEGTAEDDVFIVMEKVIRRRTEVKAQEVAEELHMVVTRDNREVTLSTNRDQFRRRNFSTHFTISVPNSMDVKVKNSYGLVRVSDVGEAEIINRHGPVTALNISGNLIAQNSYEDVNVEDVMLDCSVDSRESSLWVSGVKGSTQIKHRYGRIDLKDLQQDVIVEGSHSKIYAENITGPLDLESSYENITLIDVGPTTVRGNTSPMDIQDVAGRLEIKNKYSHVTLKNIRGEVEIEGNDVGILGRDIRGEVISISTTYKDIELEDFAGETILSLSNGKAILKPAPLTAPVEVKGSYAAITFYWPQEGIYPIEAQVKTGDIQWELPQEPNMNVTNGLSILKAFTDTEGPGIHLATSYATIAIKEFL